MECAKAGEFIGLMKQMARLQHQIVQRLMDKHGLSLSQPHLIRVLERQGDGLTQVELSRRLDVTPASINAMLKRMERDGLV